MPWIHFTLIVPFRHSFDFKYVTPRCQLSKYQKSVSRLSGSGQQKQQKLLQKKKKTDDDVIKEEVVCVVTDVLQVSFAHVWVVSFRDSPSLLRKGYTRRSRFSTADCSGLSKCHMLSVRLMPRKCTSMTRSHCFLFFFVSRLYAIKN